MPKKTLPKTVRIRSKTDDLADIIQEQSGLINQLKTELEAYSESSKKQASEIAALRQDVTTLKRTLSAVDQRAGRMRLDKQFKYALGFLTGKRDFQVSATEPAPAEFIAGPTQPLALPAPAQDAQKNNESDMWKFKADIAIICPTYPGGNRKYGGEFVQRRVEYYSKSGLDVLAIEIRPEQTNLQQHTVNGITVLRMNAETLSEILKTSPFKTIGVHSIERPVWTAISPHLTKVPLVVWVHGFEARDWRELEFNYDEQQLKALKTRLDKANRERRLTMSEVFLHPAVTPIFVSNYMREVAEKFAKSEADNGVVIHNGINPDDFPYEPKDSNLRKSILWIRSFATHNYANDISRDFILALSKQPVFEEINISIFGDGALFEQTLAPLRGFKNISIHQGFLTTEEIREQHKRHGIMLVPSRWDSQGLTCGEAMASGLVPLTSRVAALPEFVDNSVGVLAPLNDHETILAGYLNLLEDPEMFREMSAAASKRSISQCGPEHTMASEVTLLKMKI